MSQLPSLDRAIHSIPLQDTQFQSFERVATIHGKLEKKEPEPRNPLTSPPITSNIPSQKPHNKTVQFAPRMSADNTLLLEEYCNRKVLIIVTGGTFIMAPSEKGLIVQPGYLSKRMESDPDFKHRSLPLYDIYEWKTPLDSANLTPQHWGRLATEIAKFYYDYDGFIVLHGTDTMAYTASALSFMLENIGKPVILTGAQIPIGEVFNDAKNNLIASMCVVGCADICEVCVMFNSELLRGNRCTKSNPWRQNAYSSPNFPRLGIFGIDLEMENGLFLAVPKKRFRIHLKMFNNIIVLWIVPGVTETVLKGLLMDSAEKAVVLAFYGVGYTEKRKDFYAIIKQLIDSGTPVVIMKQSLKGYVDTGLYDTKDEFTLSDLISAEDMTVEAVVTKLGYLMGKGYRGKMLKCNMERNLRGEITPLKQISQKVISVSRPNVS